MVQAAALGPVCAPAAFPPSPACDLLPLRNQVMHGFLDTLAAAHAEAGNFAQAVKYQEKAVRMAPLRVRKKFQARLVLYRQNKPYREPPP